jgi:hypothetical protein
MLKSKKAVSVTSSKPVMKKVKPLKAPTGDQPYLADHPVSVAKQVEDYCIAAILLGRGSPIAPARRKCIRTVAETIAEVYTGILSTDRKKKRLAYLHTYCFRFAAAAVRDPKLHGCDPKVVSRIVASAKKQAKKLGTDVLTV